MEKHKQHYYEQNPSRGLWTWNRFVLPHVIHNVMDTYASLEYKCHSDVATIIKFWASANPDNVFFFQQEVIALMSSWLKFSIRIQTAT
jgi:hypothetical protein